MKVPKVFELPNCVVNEQTLGTSVIYSPMSPPFLLKVQVNFHSIFRERLQSPKIQPLNGGRRKKNAVQCALKMSIYGN